MNTSMIITITIISAFILTYLGTGFIRYYSLKKAILDIPNERSSHTVPTPRGAGTALALVFFIGVGALYFTKFISGHLASALLIGGILVALIGYLDDLYSLGAKIRALCHLIAAVIAVLVLHGMPNLFLNAWNVQLGFIGSVVAVVGIIWLINLYNFMDGIDGLAGSEALFVSLAAGTILWAAPEHNISYICFLLAATALGFLLWNWPPAKIFLGDAGSGLLGFIFAVLTIESVRQNSSSIFFWLILLGVFIFDATFTLLHRIKRKEKWYAAHRDHIYQRLIKAGASHRTVTLSLIAVNIFVLLPIAYAAILKPQFAFWFFLATILFFWLLWLFLIRLLDQKELNKTKQ